MIAQDAPPSTREGQLRSPFAEILERLCLSVVGGIAAGLADDEGECVDLASAPVPITAGAAQNVGGYGVKLAAAHWQIVMREAVAQRRLGGIRQLWVTSGSCAYVVVALHAGYAFLLLCSPASLSAVSQRAIRQCEVELSLEAGWPLPQPNLPIWKRVGVALDGEGRPQALRYARQWHPGLEVLGVPAGPLASFERGYRVRHDEGTELDLVRESAGFWYAGGSMMDLEVIYRG